jgi:hypothetical protein
VGALEHRSPVAVEERVYNCFSAQDLLDAPTIGAFAPPSCARKYRKALITRQLDTTS